ncbi:hypothetical protein FQA39_LY11284 [Lamprigera yunnana]|nr:hypothetical protein FQA39_LY11284 [Lamprigera yunnana]
MTPKDLSTTPTEATVKEIRETRSHHPLQKEKGRGRPNEAIAQKIKGRITSTTVKKKAPRTVLKKVDKDMKKQKALDKLVRHNSGFLGTLGLADMFFFKLSAAYIEFIILYIICDSSTSHNAQPPQRHVLSEDARKIMWNNYKYFKSIKSGKNQLDNNVLFCYISLQSYRQRFGDSCTGNWGIEKHTMEESWRNADMDPFHRNDSSDGDYSPSDSDSSGDDEVIANNINTDDEISQENNETI